MRPIEIVQIDQAQKCCQRLMSGPRRHGRRDKFLEVACKLQEGQAIKAVENRRRYETGRRASLANRSVAADAARLSQNFRGGRFDIKKERLAR